MIIYIYIHEIRGQENQKRLLEKMGGVDLLVAHLNPVTGRQRMWRRENVKLRWKECVAFYKKHTVDGCEILHHLINSKHPIIYRVSTILLVVQDFATIHSIIHGMNGGWMRNLTNKNAIVLREYYGF